MLRREGDGVYWQVLLQHRLWAQRLLPHRDVRRVHLRVHDRATVPRATVPRERGLRRCHNRCDTLQRTPPEQVYHSQREGLSVGQSSSSVSDRSGQPVVERFQELNTEFAQSRTLLDRQREQILEDCQEEIKKARVPGWLWPKEVYKNWMKRSSRNEKNFIGLKQKDFIDEINNFFMNVLLKPNLTFDELNDSSVPFSFMIPSTEKDVDDVTLGKMVTAAHRGQVDYCESEGMSVSRSSSVMFDRSGQPDERKNSNAQIRTLLEEQRQTIIAENIKVGHHELQASSRRRRAPTSTRRIMATEIGISWSSSTKSYRNGRIMEIPGFYLRWVHQTEVHRGPEHNFGIIRKSTVTAKWSKSYERF